MRHIIDSIPYDPNVKSIGKVGGYPTYEPTEGYDVKGYFLMELYNNDIIHGNEDIICWQIYQYNEQGGAIECVIPIYQSAEPFSSSVSKRRWLKEFSLIEISSEDVEDIEYQSSFGDSICEDDVEHCKCHGLDYVGIIYEKICNRQLKLGTGFIYFGFDKNGDLRVIT